MRSPHTRDTNNANSRKRTCFNARQKGSLYLYQLKPHIVFSCSIIDAASISNCSQCFDLFSEHWLHLSVRLGRLSQRTLKPFTPPLPPHPPKKHTNKTLGTIPSKTSPQCHRPNNPNGEETEVASDSGLLGMSFTTRSGRSATSRGITFHLSNCLGGQYKLGRE